MEVAAIQSSAHDRAASGLVGVQWQFPDEAQARGRRGIAVSIESRWPVAASHRVQALSRSVDGAWTAVGARHDEANMASIDR
jgi:hypothetical protein